MDGFPGGIRHGCVLRWEDDIGRTLLLEPSAALLSPPAQESNAEIFRSMCRALLVNLEKTHIESKV